MRKYSSKKYKLLRRILAVCMVIVLVGSIIHPVFMSEASDHSKKDATQKQSLETEFLLSGEQLQAEMSEDPANQKQIQTEQIQTEQVQPELKETEQLQTESKETKQLQTESETTGQTEEKETTPSTEKPKDSGENSTEAGKETQERQTEKQTQESQTEKETEKQEEVEINSAQIQKQFNRQMKAMMSVELYGDTDLQETAKSFTDLYPQYADYNGEMESVSVEKVWTGDASYNRPESVTFDLYLDEQVISTLTLSAADDWKGSFTGHYPAYKLDAKGNVVKDSEGKEVLLNYQVKERSVNNYVAAYSQQRYQTTVDTSKMHLFVPATEVKEGEQYLIVSSNQVGSQKVYRAEAYQTDKVLSSQITVSDGKIKDTDGNRYENYILINDGDGSYNGLLWNAYAAGNNRYYMFSNVYEIWEQCHGLLQMSSTQAKMSCPHTGTLGTGTDVTTQGFYNAGSDQTGNAYKTAGSSENLYFYKEVVLPDNAFNNWRTEALVSNRYDPPITTDPDGTEASAKTDMSVTKKWENDSESDRPASITVHLYADGKDTKETLTLNAANKWTGSFKDLDIYKAGKRISYSVEEDVPEGYSVTYKYDNVGNSSSEQSDASKDNADSGDSSSVKGYWVRTDKLVNGETYLIVTSPKTGSVVGMEIEQSGKNFNWTSSKNAGTIQVGGSITINGQTYAAHITQEEAEAHTRMQWKAHAAGKSTANQVGYHNWFTLESVSNPGCYAKFNGEGDISDGTAKESKMYYGQQYTTESGGQNGYVAVDENGDKQNRTPTVENYPNDFSYVFGAANDYFLLTNNHTGDANSVTAQTFFLYKFVPVSGPSVTITNTKSDETSLTVYKNWNDNNNQANKRPQSIEVELLKNGKETGIKAELGSDNGWKYIFEHLPKVDENGKEIQYSAKECNLPEGYTSSVITGTVGGTEEQVTYSYAWVPVTRMQDGKQYILASDIKGSPSTIGVSGSSATLSGASVPIKTDVTLTDESDNHYSACITDEDAKKATLWTAHTSGGYIVLENGGKYFEKGKGNLQSSSDKATGLQYDDSGHALKDKKGKYMADNGDFNQNNPKVTTYLFERVRIKTTTTVDTTQNVTTITNTYKEKPISMPETGSKSRAQTVLLGFWLLVGGTLLMINNKKGSDRTGVVKKK